MKFRRRKGAVMDTFQTWRGQSEINNVLYFLCMVEGKALHWAGAEGLRNVSKICGKGERKPQENRCGELLAGLGQMDCTLCLYISIISKATHPSLALGHAARITALYYTRRLDMRIGEKQATENSTEYLHRTGKWNQLGLSKSFQRTLQKTFLLFKSKQHGK